MWLQQRPHTAAASVAGGCRWRRQQLQAEARPRRRVRRLWLRARLRGASERRSGRRGAAGPRQAGREPRCLDPQHAQVHRTELHRSMLKVPVLVVPQLTTLASWGLLFRSLAALRTRHERLSRAGPNRRLRGSLEVRPKSPIRRLLAPRRPLRVRGSDADESETRQSLLGSDGMDDDCASSDLITPAGAPHRGLWGILRLSWAVRGGFRF